jgi:hypothetical protein
MNKISKIVLHDLANVNFIKKTSQQIKLLIRDPTTNPYLIFWRLFPLYIYNKVGIKQY